MYTFWLSNCRFKDKKRNSDLHVKCLTLLLLCLFQIMASSSAGSYTAPERSEVSHTMPERSDDTYTTPERSECSYTTPFSSDKLQHHLCECCIEDGVTKEAQHYCQDCRQNICDTCKDYHRKLAGTRDHTVTPVNKGLAAMKKQSKETVLKCLKVQSRSEVNVKAGDDRETPFITGCTVMANGDAVLCDGYNSKIKLLNSSGVLTGNLKLSFKPWDVSAIDSTSVIVTIPTSKQLQVVLVSPKLKPGRVVKLDKKCWGVEVVKDDIYVTCHNYPGEGEIRVLGLDGKVKRRLGINQDGSFMFTSPGYITVNQSCEKIFLSDLHTDTVTCISVDGHVIYTYENVMMIEPEGLLCDSDDNILVCGGNSENVQVVTADGEWHSNLLADSDRLKEPHSIAYRDNDNTLLVGCYKNSLLIFKLTK